MASLATELIGYLGGLRVASGDRAGEAFEVLPWQRRFVRHTFSGSTERAEVGLSVGRGNGKSALVAAVASAVVAPGAPLHGPRREVSIVASSFDQGRICFDDLRFYLGLEGRRRAGLACLG